MTLIGKCKTCPKFNKNKSKSTDKLSEMFCDYYNDICKAHVLNCEFDNRVFCDFCLNFNCDICSIDKHYKSGHTPRICKDYKRKT